jgi:transposase
MAARQLEFDLETGQGVGFRERGLSKERRLEPQITIGMPTGRDGYPLMVSAFEGNRAETKAILGLCSSRASPLSGNRGHLRP